MIKSDAAHHWYSVRRALKRQARVDPAAMGTTIGLELSLAENADALAPSAAAPQARGVRPSRLAWLQRLANRRKPLP